MKFECPECKALAPPRTVRARGKGELEIQCGTCGIVSRVSAAVIAPPRIDPDKATVECPKCGHRQVDPEACDRCGLVFERYDPARANAESDEAGIALWGAVESAWTDEVKHRAFFDYCMAMGLWAYAAQQYDLARRDLARRELAVRQISRIHVVAEQALLATKPPSRDKRGKRFKLVVTILAFLLCAAMLIVVVTRWMGSGTVLQN